MDMLVESAHTYTLQLWQPELCPDIVDIARGPSVSRIIPGWKLVL